MPNNGEDVIKNTKHADQQIEFGKTQASTRLQKQTQWGEWVWIENNTHTHTQTHTHTYKERERERERGPKIYNSNHFWFFFFFLRDWIWKHIFLLFWRTKGSRETNRERGEREREHPDSGMNLKTWLAELTIRMGMFAIRIEFAVRYKFWTQFRLIQRRMITFFIFIISIFFFANHLPCGTLSSNRYLKKNRKKKKYITNIRERYGIRSIHHPASNSKHRASDWTHARGH